MDNIKYKAIKIDEKAWRQARMAHLVEKSSCPFQDFLSRLVVKGLKQKQNKG